jgi:hypothetical protein
MNMLNRDDAQKVADQINETAREMVRSFVMAHADLTPEAFDAEADAFLSAVERRMRERLGGDLDEVDGVMMEAYSRAMRFEYKRLRSAGVAVTGSA